jgi:hypothetical protein
MLYLVPEASNQVQADEVSADLYNLKVDTLYLGPTIASLATTYPLAAKAHNNGDTVRRTVPYALAGPKNKADLSTSVLIKYKLHQQHVQTADHEPDGTEAAFKQRIVDWFTNEFMADYMNAPNPTAIVADRQALLAIAQYLSHRQQQREILGTIYRQLIAGSILEYRPDGLYLQATRWIK